MPDRSSDLPLLGLHVSPAGGLPKAIERGVALGCESIQIFSQSPRRWAPTNHSEESIAEFREALAASPIQSVVIHALYLANAATPDPELREKSLAAITHSLRVGDAIGADGVVLHPGSAKDGDPAIGIENCGEVFKEALAESDHCPLLLEDTAGTGGTLGRSFDELHRLLEVSGGHERIGLCLDSCHLLASGYDVRTASALDAVLAEADASFGLDRLRCIHVNDSQTPLGSNRDRHAPLGEGEIGEEGIAAVLSEPRFGGLPVIFEGPGTEGKEPTAADMEIALRLRDQGRAARGLA
ncbi:Endonuclease IV [Patulibacter medicamentivorans]|jgi:deoxyribonuclease-4|uniref:Probable endonuclease 4 n=1 Tax=Patulibacter medicamentivorans TaxID=1097667 RepID=H0E227_9ACTN|nr:deoxyribonuclease IV [Patulibacter medicamentivorans]EHN12237.1 Endonuclease IV [Patulibacter medicamentivorans]